MGIRMRPFIKINDFNYRQGELQLDALWNCFGCLSLSRSSSSVERFSLVRLCVFFSSGLRSENYLVLGILTALIYICFNLETNSMLFCCAQDHHHWSHRRRRHHRRRQLNWVGKARVAINLVKKITTVEIGIPSQVEELAFHSKLMTCGVIAKLCRIPTHLSPCSTTPALGKDGVNHGQCDQLKIAKCP